MRDFETKYYNASDFETKALQVFVNYLWCDKFWEKNFTTVWFFLDQSFTRCQNSIQHFHSVWVLEPIYSQRFRFRINTTTRLEILKQNLHNDVPFCIKNLTSLSGPEWKIYIVSKLWIKKFTLCQLVKGMSDFKFWIKSL